MYLEEHRPQHTSMQCTQEQAQSLLAEADTLEFLAVGVKSPYGFRDYLDSLQQGLKQLAQGQLSRESFDELHDLLHYHLMNETVSDGDLSSTLNRIHMLFHAVMKENG